MIVSLYFSIYLYGCQMVILRIVKKRYYLTGLMMKWRDNVYNSPDIGKSMNMKQKTKRSGLDMRKQKSNKLWLGILGGAVAGIAISLLDKNTRNSVMTGSKSMMTNAKSMAKNPDDIVGSLKEMSSKLRTSIEQISEDVAFISSKVDEMKEVPPQVAGVIKETKEVVVDKHTNKNENEQTSTNKNATSTSIQ